MRSVLAPFIVCSLSIALAACADPATRAAHKKSDDPSFSSDPAPDGNITGAQTPATPPSKTSSPPPPSAPRATPAPLAEQTPRKGRVITSPRQVIGLAMFKAEAPAMRANDFHTFDVTGKDCMTCHGASGPATHFAYGGTIALGKKWKWAPALASAIEDSDYYDGSDDDSYEDEGYSDTYDDDDDGYDDAYDDDDGYGYGSGQRMKGAPSDRSTPSRYTRIRIVGADGYIFDTVTDDDGNFWFKSTQDVKVPAYTGITYGPAFVVTGSTNGIACASCHESSAEDSPGRLWTWDGRTPRWNE